MSSLDVQDTIAAIASPPGGGLRGIIRISGPSTVACLSDFFISEDGCTLHSLTTATTVAGAVKLDDRLELPGQLLLWPNRRSYTRQPSAEIHTLGSTPLLEIALAKLCQSGARMAEPGEFTLRAFLSGRIDLTQAEAVLAVIDANGKPQLENALRQLAGGLTGPLSKIRKDLIHVVAELEAGLDFVDEDIEFISHDELTRQLNQIHDSLELLLDQISSRNTSGGRIKVALMGVPNAGKSSLLNALVGNQQSIVAPIEGTTRDFVTATLSVNNFEIELVDTAGLENSSGPADSIHSQAQTKSTEQIADVDIRILCIDGSRPLDADTTELLPELNRNDLIVLTKKDLTSTFSQLPDSIHQVPIRTSVETMEGVEQLKARIVESCLQVANVEAPVVGTTILRAASNLTQALACVNHSQTALRDKIGHEVVAAELRSALEQLGLVVGTIYNDDILDQIFGKFCIGK